MRLDTNTVLALVALYLLTRPKASPAPAAAPATATQSAGGGTFLADVNALVGYVEEWWNAAGGGSPSTAAEVPAQGAPVVAPLPPPDAQDQAVNDGYEWGGYDPRLDDR